MNTMIRKLGVKYKLSEERLDSIVGVTREAIVLIGNEKYTNSLVLVYMDSFLWTRIILNILGAIQLM